MSLSLSIIAKCNYARFGMARARGMRTRSHPCARCQAETWEVVQKRAFVCAAEGERARDDVEVRAGLEAGNPVDDSAREEVEAVRLNESVARSHS